LRLRHSDQRICTQTTWARSFERGDDLALIPVPGLHFDGLRARDRREDDGHRSRSGNLLDATVIRTLIVPAVIALMGRWNWWLPRWPARLLRVEPSLPPRVAAGEAKA
jgi:hypothetical protein